MVDLSIAIVISFLATYFFTPYVIRYFRLVGITTADVHKKNKPLIPQSAGVPVAIGVMAGLLVSVFIQTFLLNNVTNFTDIFAAMTTIMIITFVGLIDDLNTKQVKLKDITSVNYQEGKGGLSSWQKPLLTIAAVLPLVVIKAGQSTMTLPILGSVNFGILYPLIIIPIGIVGAANMVNMLGGFNGLEAGLGLIYATFLGLFAYLHGSYIAASLFLATAAALLAILKYNWCPAKILPGDSITYLLGAIVATGAILGNMERAAIIAMVPFIIQGALKLYARLKLGRFPTDLGILQKDGTIKSRYGKSVYSWTHLIMKSGNFTEKQIVMIMMGIQLVFSLIPFILT